MSTRSRDENRSLRLAGCARMTAALLAMLLVLVLLLPLTACEPEATATSPSGGTSAGTTAASTSASATASSTAASSGSSATSPTTASTSPATAAPTTASPPVRVSDDYRNYYEIFVRSFFDQNGDGLGDLAGVTEKLDYLAGTLGADGIWLMPICPSPSYHKYDVTDYLAVDPEYGTLADFDRLVAEAHKRDIRLIIDLVLNHTSNQHPWFDKAVQALWKGEYSPYIQYYNFTLEDRGQGYSKITDKYSYECRFVSSMPDLNLDSPAVREEIRQITQFWLDRGVDGFRLDAVTSYYTGSSSQNIEFMTWLNRTIKARKPDAYIVGEAWTDSLAIADCYASGVDSFFNFPWSQATGLLVAALNERSGRRLAEDLAAWNRLIRQKNPAAKDALFLSNHDQARSAGFLLRSLPRQKLAAALYLLAPGNPFIYYGEELGMTGSGADPNKRLPMVWSETDLRGATLAPPGATQTISGLKGADEQARDPDSLLRFYRQVLDIKARHPEIARGIMTNIPVEPEGVALFSLASQGRTVIVCHNLADASASIDLVQTGLQGFTLTDSLVSGGTERPARDGQVLIMPPMTTAILA